MYPKGAPTSTSVKVQGAAETSEEKIPRQKKSTLSADELREEYWYVYNDLKRIALIAGVLFALLIVLAFVI